MHNNPCVEEEFREVNTIEAKSLTNRRVNYLDAQPEKGDPNLVWRKSSWRWSNLQLQGSDLIVHMTQRSDFKSS